MKIRRLTSAMILCGGLLMAGCGNQPGGEGQGEQTPEPVVFTAEQLGSLIGDFYANDSILSIGTNGATLKTGEEVIALENKSVALTGFDAVVRYTDANGKNYRVQWTEGDKKQVVLTVDNVDTTFKPSLEAVQGWYNGFGEVVTGNVVYIVTNEFNSEFGLFNMGAANASYGYLISEACYLDSFFVEVGEEDDKVVKMGLDFFFSDDLEVPYETYHVDFDETEGKIYLLYEDEEEWFVCTDVDMFSFSFFDEDDFEYGLMGSDGYCFYELDQDEKLITIGWGDPETYVESFDEHGQLVTIGDKVIRGTGYGITVEEEGTVKELPFYDWNGFMAIFETEFNLGNQSICLGYDWDNWVEQCIVNGEPADESKFEVYDHQMAFKGTVDEDVYYMVPTGATSSVNVVKNDEYLLYFNVAELSELYARDYLLGDGSVASIDEDLVLTMGTNTISGELIWDDYFGGVVVSFDGAIFTEIDPDNGLYGMIFDEDNQLIFFDKDYIESFYGSWKGSGLTVELGETISIGGTDCVITQLTPLNVGEAFVPGFNAMLSLEPQSGCMIALMGNSISLFDLTGSFIGDLIPDAAFDSIVGEYNLSGDLGVEKMIVGADGSFKLDSLNQTKDGLVLVDYDYYLSYEDGEVTLAFIRGEYAYPITFDGNGHAQLFDFTYLEKFWFENQAFFGDGTNLLVIHDNKVQFNGEVLEVEGIEGKVITTEINEKATTITIGEGNVTIAMEGETEIVLNKLTESMDSFNGTYVKPGNTDYDIKIQNGKIYEEISGQEIEEDDYLRDADGNALIPTFEYVDGNLTMSFSFAMIDFTFTFDGAEVTVDVVNNIPLPPPPPPLPF